jgi:UDP-3-O-[3-hydroxymyristoyl] glucosamine N-acyltransferase
MIINNYKWGEDSMFGELRFSKDELSVFLSERNILPLGKIISSLHFSRVKPINIACKTDVAFCRFEGDEGLKMIESSAAGLIFIPKSFHGSIRRENSLLLPCDTPRLEMLRFIDRFWFEEEPSYDLKANPIIHQSAVIEQGVKIGPFSVIGPGVTIGRGSQIGSNCHIQNASIGLNTCIGSSVTIGGTGFGFENDDSTGEVLNFPHIGGVRIGDNVYIGSSTCIDRGSIGDTVVGDDTKIDNLVHIAHNVLIGSRCKIIALTVIGGSVKIGDNSWLSPGSVIRDWRTIGKNTVVGLGAVVVKDIEDGSVVVGNPAKPMNKTLNRYK